jgi:formate hydrogenlyase transcriptional activator
MHRAIAQKIGRLELADHGTLFLDEIGDIPAELQPKLLRALQEREFERLGSNRTIKADVRLIAATNRDLTKWHWPRNIRELENLIERAVILSSGSVLNAPIAEIQLGTPSPARTEVARRDAVASGGQSDKLEDAEREYILKILRETNGTLSGPNGAAERLGVKRTTLQAKMKKLGIGRGSI